MATISCEPADLAAAAACYQCIPPSMQKAVEIYLLNIISGLNLSVAELMENAKCYQCIPPDQMDSVLAYLGCQSVP